MGMDAWRDRRNKGMEMPQSPSDGLSTWSHKDTIALVGIGRTGGPVVVDEWSSMRSHDKDEDEDEELL